MHVSKDLIWRRESEKSKQWPQTSKTFVPMGRVTCRCPYKASVGWRGQATAHRPQTTDPTATCDARLQEPVSQSQKVWADLKAKLPDRPEKKHSLITEDHTWSTKRLQRSNKERSIIPRSCTLLRLISDYGLHHPSDHPWSPSSMNVRDHMHGRNTSGDLMTFPDIQRVALWQLQPPGMDDSVATKARAAAAAASPARRPGLASFASRTNRRRCRPCPPALCAVSFASSPSTGRWLASRR